MDARSSLETHGNSVTGNNVRFRSDCRVVNRMNKPPVISIGMPVYNGERYLEQTLECVLNQTFQDFELIISDNASTDRTQEICEEAARRDSRIRYIRQPENLGAPANYNKVLEPARGTYFKWAAANDLFDGSLVEKCIGILETHPEVVLCYPRSRLIDGEGKSLGDYEDGLHIMQDSPSERFQHVLSHLRLSNALNGVFRLSALRACRPVGLYLSSDVHLLAEMSLRGKFYELPETLFYRRMDQASSTVGRPQKELIAFHRPKDRSRSEATCWRLDLGHFEIVHRTPIQGKEKRRLYRYLLRKLVWDRRQLMAELLTCLKELWRR
ncbi:MAG: glycosyltransferase [Candidatus Zixiibacteriota bacterium]|nr:MAG: glycosyltransferase [candidate division Zixibacteria bacterium]